MSVQRKNVRHKTSDYFLVYDSDTGELVGRVINLSLDGAMLIGDQPVDIPTRHTCRLALPEDIDGRKWIKFVAESRWCRKNNKCDWFETGYKFVTISDEDRFLLNKLISTWTVVETDKSHPSPNRQT